MDFHRYQWSNFYAHQHYYLEVMRFNHGVVIVRDDNGDTAPTRRIRKDGAGQTYYKKYLRTDRTDLELCKLAIAEMEGEE